LGGLVRATGSGMGCPDWPKCFGEYIPPTKASDLPVDYQETFKRERVRKLGRFTKLLEMVGFSELAEKVSKNEMVDESHEFNVSKAYIEYINRLFGALTGVVVFIAFWLSFYFFKTHKFSFWQNLLGFAAVFFNALLGAVVVNSNLIPGIVTAHFLAAFGAIAFFIMARIRLNSSNIAISDFVNIKHLKVISTLLLFLVIIQIILGTQVRSSYDLYYWHQISEPLISFLGLNFQLHRVLGVIVIIVAIYQYKKYQALNLKIINRLNVSFVALCLLQIIFGVMTLGEIGVAISKLFHITFGASIFIIQFYICAVIFNHSKERTIEQYSS
jgi:heme a synthase